MKYRMLLPLLFNGLIARPPNEVTEITRPVSPVQQDIQLYVRITSLLKKQRKAHVSSHDPTLIALMNVLNNAWAAANIVPGDSPVNRMTIEDHDLRRAIHYLDQSLEAKTKLL